MAEHIITFDPARLAVPADDYEPEAEAVLYVTNASAASQAARVFWDRLTDEDRGLLSNLHVPARQLEANGFLNLKSPRSSPGNAGSNSICSLSWQ